MKLIRLRPSDRIPAGADSYVGTVFTHMLVREDSTAFRIAEVTFHDGGRTKIHAHTTDQVLIVTSGVGMVATRDEQYLIAVGEIVLIPAGEPHVHGAKEGADLTHFSILGHGSMIKRYSDWPTTAT